MDCRIDLETADGHHVDSFIKTCDCLCMVIDWARCRIGETYKNGSVIGKVKIHQEGDETEDDCITIG